VRSLERIFKLRIAVRKRVATFLITLPLLLHNFYYYNMLCYAKVTGPLQQTRSSAPVTNRLSNYGLCFVLLRPIVRDIYDCVQSDRGRRRGRRDS
jgi:hypothetical protein